MRSNKQSPPPNREKDMDKNDHSLDSFRYAMAAMNPKLTLFQKIMRWFRRIDISNFIWYKILYPIFNFIGLNRQLNLFRHWLGVYPRFMDGRCQWCGTTGKHLSWKEIQEQMEKNRKNIELKMKKIL